ncbi:hypothetical protein [Metabacillus hrfriensis]|uniref:Uncharacterized protein n=1 Tax=Metabacillus hrfriensis TaxID=3048891 RepID=A0ACD4R8Y6_9BACI|nr:hypothetical protein [Metabacillus sp. CT-WN-B3]WHZ56813.1 hypothetical protein QLQ22_19280 [Metabacillus sp. CT-WN-B3]
MIAAFRLNLIRSLAMLLGTGMAAIAAAGFDAVKKITRSFLPFLLAG